MCPISTHSVLDHLGMIETPSHAEKVRTSLTLTAHIPRSADQTIPLKPGNRRINEVNDILVADVNRGTTALGGDTKRTGAVLNQLMLDAETCHRLGTTTSDVCSDFFVV
ncbi:unnamed protein product [Penicillium salamii]|uniref:Uncharacterized protein n=1 Tax=Penicillium salamii TaxID=1612424 RepID=A0A9W4IWG9_9EURO|nr:unnamed protein product [Penicillium salamii]